MTPVNNWVNVIIQVYSWHQLINVHYWQSDTQCCFLALRHSCNKLQLVTSKLFYHFWYSDHLQLVAKISRCWPPTKSKQPFEPLRFKTVPRGKVFERLGEVEYYHILHFWHSAYTGSTGWSKKTAQSLWYHNFATVHHRVMWFSAKCSERNSLHE